MKITGTRSRLIVEMNGRTLHIAGELTTTPVFYADASSIRNWEPPYQNDVIADAERQKIIAAILAENARQHGITIRFD